MTDEEQRIAIAEACGWVWWRFTDKSNVPFYYLGHGSSDWPTTHGRNGVKCERPTLDREDCDWTGTLDYPNDLNAMHVAWQIDPPPPFTDSFNFRCELAWQLELIVTRDYDAKPFWKDRPFPMFKEQIWTARNYWMVHATARQRAESFLRTIGKWVEHEICSPRG